ncbi:MAG: hypothetical protein EWV63_21395 [Microcystis aeruginosa Ma_OC_H_19870700_S124]|uniref:Lipopolysaccharide biosynthesis protein n=1 Tax=Microcystis aeruginosa Ma_OC_H_19870700_S124 TaxID=2486262 RepID=A0A552A8I7_MICAE|nr:MAG: hypothetical protein EWV63_21395 [Microcystis aeruginosa Ma_OC_H_19870700_S124]
MADNFSKQFAKNLSWQAFTVLFRAIISIATISVLAHLAGPEVMGLFGLAWIGPTIAFALVQSGISQGLILVEDIKPGHIAAATWLTFFVAVGLACIIAAAAPFVAEIYQTPELAPATLISAVVVPLMAMGVVDMARAQKNLDFRLIAKVQTVAVFLCSVIAIGLAFFWKPIVGLISFQGLLGAAQFLVFRLNGVKAQSLRTSRHEIADIWYNGKQFILVSLSASVMLNTPQIVLGFFVTQAELGYFNLGRRLIEIINNQIGGIANQVIFPSIAKIRHDLKMVASVYLKTSRLTAAVMMAPLVFLAVEPSDFLVLYAGPDWAAAGQTLFFLLLFQGGLSLGQNIFSVFQATGKASLVWKWNLGVATLQAVLILAYGRESSEAAAIVMAMSAPVTLLAAILLSRHIGFSMKTWSINMARVVLSAALIVFSVRLSGILDASAWGPLLKFLIHGSFAASLYVILISVLDPAIRYSILKRLKRH